MQPREVLTSAGAVEVTAPPVDDRRTDPYRPAEAVLQVWARKTRRSPRCCAAVPARPVQRGIRGPAGSRAAGPGAHSVQRIESTLKAPAALVSGEPAAQACPAGQIEAHTVASRPCDAFTLKTVRMR